MLSSVAFARVALVCLTMQLVACVPLPVAKTKVVDTAKVNDPAAEERKQEYKRYIDELVQELGADPEIRKQLETMSKDDLENLLREIRSPEDEEWREELEEQRRLQRHRMDREQDIRERPDGYEMNQMPDNDEELDRMMREHQERMSKIDQRQHEQFVKHEMHQEHERRKKLKGLSEKERLEAEEKHEAERAKAKKHPRMHHPGSQPQLEEVWEKQDGMDSDNWNAETFFHMHDTNEDQHLDYSEVEALMTNEVEKVHHDPNSLEYREEMSKMRQHVVNEVDKNRDGMISLQEFLDYSNLKQFAQDDEWKDIDDEDQYTDEDFDEYEKLMEEQERRENGLLQDDREATEHQPAQHAQAPPHHEQQAPFVSEHPAQQLQHHEQPPQQHHEQPPQQQQHHEQPSQQHHEQQPQQQQHHEQPSQQHHEQPPQQQQHHEQPSQQHHEQPPQQQQHHEQPSQQHHEQPPQQQQHHEQPSQQHHEQPPQQRQHHEQPSQQQQHHEQPSQQHHEQPPQQLQHHEQPPQHHQQPPQQQHHEQPQQPHHV